MATVVVTVEIEDADFRKDYDVDPERPLVELVRRIAKEEGIPLVTRQGRPLAWEAEGPDWRPGKAGTTDLTRTQPLKRITARMQEEHGERKPLFEILLSIPGAAENIQEARESAKRDEIQARLAQRQAERAAEELGSASTMVLEPADTGHFGDFDDTVTERMTSAPGPEEETEIDRPPPRRQRPGGGPSAAAGGAPVESRIRRAKKGSGDGAGASGASGTGRRRARSAPGAKPGASGTGRRRAQSGSSGGADGTSRKRSADSPRKSGAGGRKGKKDGGGIPTLAIAGAAAFFLVGLLVVVILLLSRKPEPSPEPVVELPPEAPIDVPMQAPEPEPEPEPEPVTPPPVKFTTFYSTGSVSSGSAASAGAQLSSFAKQELKLGYTVPSGSAGGHSIELKGRFTLTVSESGSSLQGGSTASCAGAPAGSDTRVSIQWTGDTVSARVGGSRCGPVPVASQSGFAAWKFKLPSGSQLKGVWASAPEDSE